ncbi:MAG: hypothetical protein KDA27_14965 [Candidatus Eisenbacteria bacterium]|uniref:carboxypeptidase T n=1 Tax=Eiseniibacteriota bacterium TaxID=2212470 RepID=A0A956SG92_UNCEI|nr:hypothetical protein [Candidatus Eisenbacteria bacterium]
MNPLSSADSGAQGSSPWTSSTFSSNFSLARVLLSSSGDRVARPGRKAAPWVASALSAAMLPFAALGTALAADPGDSAETPTYQQIRVAGPLSDSARDLIRSERLELMGEDDGGFRFVVTPDQVDALEAAGLDFEIQVDDLAAFYESRLVAERLANGGPTTGTGNFGIFHTYDETVDALNLLHAEFPDITTAPFSIGQTLEGREMWAIKVSDNPDVDEDEGEVLFDGMHHAREIMTVEMLLDFSRYLCENYETDPVVTRLVDSREIFFVPIVNPDGFVYNETTNPSGGGMWRKNRRVNDGSSCRGVDINRNYDYEWVGTGSSTDPCSDTFRGASPESEPEIQNHTAFIDSHDFVVWQSYHSVAGMVLFPWGYTSTPTSEDAIYETMAAEMARDSGYQTGQPPEILYNVNGAAFDWGHGATNRHERIFSFTTEISGSGFWPLESERDGLIAENLSSNLYLCKVAGAWVDVAGLEVVDGGDGELLPGETADLVVSISNPSVIYDASGVVATLRCNDPYVTLLDATSTLGSVPAGDEVPATGDPFTVSVDASCPIGRSVTFEIDVEAEGFTNSGAVELRLGSGTVLVHQDFETGAEGWATDPSHSATTGAFVAIDPNPTDFQPGDDTTPAPGTMAWITGQNSSLGTDDVDGGVSATRSAAIDLSGVQSARLELDYFFGQRDAGGDAGDFFRMSLSNDGGATFPVDLVSIGDQTYYANWQHLSVVVDDLLPLTSQMVLRVQAADGTANGDIVEAGIDEVGWFDNGTGNEPPSAPSLSSPGEGDGVPALPTLVVNNAVDPEGDPLTYGFRIWADPEMTQLVASVDGVAEGTGTTSWTSDVALDLDAVYYWRAFAADSESFGAYMAPASFYVGDVTAAPEVEAAALTRMTAGPSPASGDVRIRYYTPKAVHAELGIYDASGRNVRSLPGARWTEGWQEVVWDGRDMSGRRVPAGVYWVRLRMPTEERTLRVVRVD